MEIKLNVYKADNRKEIEKTYVCDSYDLMFGTVTDVLDVIDIDKLNDDVEVAKMVMRLYPQLRPLLKDIFEGITDDELKRVKVADLVPVFVDLFVGIAENMGVLNSKNAMRA